MKRLSRAEQDPRDDIALYNVLAKMDEELNQNFQCLRPTTPKNENLFANYTEEQKKYFLNALRQFKKDPTYQVISKEAHKGKK